MDYIDLTREQLALCLHYTKNCTFGGKSAIPWTPEERAKTLFPNNFVGQLGTLAGCIALYGQEEGQKEYIRARELADKTPFKGDGGRDIEGKNIDIKCSYMRRSKNPEDYNLLIRPPEYHKDWIYILALATTIDIEDIKTMRIYIVGWCRTNDLPANPESSGIFKGARKLSAKKLKKLPIIE